MYHAYYIVYIILKNFIHFYIPAELETIINDAVLLRS